MPSLLAFHHTGHQAFHSQNPHCISPGVPSKGSSVNLIPSQAAKASSRTEGPSARCTVWFDEYQPSA